MSQIEEEVQSDLFRSKVKKIYDKYRLYIIFFILILILGPILFQLNNLYLEKKNQKALEEYSKAMLFIKNKQDSEGIEILNHLKNNSNNFIQVLSGNTLVEYYLEKKNKIKAIAELNYIYEITKSKNEILSEIMAIKKTLLNFETISEAEILYLLGASNKNKVFKSISNKILYDYYIMKNQFYKAKEFLKN